ncbi:hypothetical protein BASA81_010965 [Batrachochytrium salamandrivorans]|nr:hypothetical protein BASA81_010965 [Batrachochytrium salamandrivorans]
MLLSIPLISIAMLSAVVNAQYGDGDDDPDSQDDDYDSDPQYTQPAHQYGQPVQQYGQPVQQYGQPAQQYGQPAQQPLQALQPQQSSAAFAGSAASAVLCSLCSLCSPFNQVYRGCSRVGVLSPRVINNSHRILRLLALLTSVVRSLMTTA